MDVDEGPLFRTGQPRVAAARMPTDLTGADWLRDGSRLLVTRPAGDVVPASITVVLDWTAALRKR